MRQQTIRQTPRINDDRVLMADSSLWKRITG
jgi:hypothetical protein